MFGRSITWFTCTCVAVTIATGCTGEDSTSVPDHASEVQHLRTDNQESSTAEPVWDVRPNSAADLGALLDAGEGALVVLVSGETRLVAHRALLASRSPALHRLLLDAGPGEVAIPDVVGPVLRQLVSHLYTLQAPQLPGVAPQLLATADRYGLLDLKVDCERQVAARLSVETAAAAAVLAVRYSCDSLKRAAIAYIRDHIFQVMATQGWADAMNSQPEIMSNVIQLLSEPAAETSSPAPGGSGTSPYPATQPYHDCSGHQTAATTVTTKAAQSTAHTEDDHISLVWALSAQEKQTRLMQAARQGEVAELEALLAAGADVQARDGGRGRWTALHWAAAQGRAGAAQCLLAAGAAVDARDIWRRTPLLWAAYHGHAAVVQLLLAAGADPAVTDEDGMTPLHWAAGYGEVEAVAALLEGGADGGASNSGGQTPLDLARMNGRQQVVDLLQGRRG